MSDSHAQLQHGIMELLPRLRRFARTMTRHHADADDLVQLSVERAITRLDQWNPQLRLDGWMFKIMKNAWIDEVRSRGRGREIFAPEEAGALVGDTSSDQQLHAMAVQQAMSELPDEQRLAVSLVLVEGLPYKEAAAVLDIPIGTLTSRLARGREALQRLLSDPGGRPQ
jgi:RNA polymerase sigma factor (sigma-70 family)